MSLTATEKEQVAVLLGWTKGPQAGSMTIWHHAEEGSGWVANDSAPPVTLENCMEYAKGKGWEHGCDYDLEDGKYHAYVYPDQNTSAVFGDESDRTVAFVRALLKAEEASR